MYQGFGKFTYLVRETQEPQRFFHKIFENTWVFATNDIFAENAWYFRNALVRANYTNLQKGIHETTEYLELFLRNMLLNEHNELHNRNMHISGLLKDTKVDIGTSKVDIGTQKWTLKHQKWTLKQDWLKKR